MKEDDGSARLRISVVTVVYNEEKNMRRCLDSVRWADEIVVIDQSSTDRTAAISREYTDKVFTVPRKGFADPDWSTAVDKASNDWIFHIDADEVITEGLRDGILRVLSSEPKFGSYYCGVRTYLLGRWIKGSGWYPNRVMRFFKKDRVKLFCGQLHVGIKPVGPSGMLQGEMVHYSYDTLGQYVEKLDRYTTILAQEAYEKGKRVRPTTSCYDFFLLPLRYYIEKLIIKRGFRDGFRGLLIATFTFFTIFLTNAKIWEIQRRADHAGDDDAPHL